MLFDVGAVGAKFGDVVVVSVGTSQGPANACNTGMARPITRVAVVDTLANFVVAA